MMEEYNIPGAETLAKIQGFWLACGLGGEVGDAFRIEGVAFEFGNSAGEGGARRRGGGGGGNGVGA